MNHSIDRTALPSEAVSNFLRNFVRPLAPRITRQYNGGVKVRDYSLIDPVLGAESLVNHDYKENLTEAVRESVSSGDDVVVVGGGFGVSVVHAYRESKGKNHYPGEITVFEPSQRRFEKCRETLSLNTRKIDDEYVNLYKAAVGSIKKKIGSVSDEVVCPANLPECDVLELDCEGAELEILGEMQIRPKKIVVETHKKFGASTEDVKQVLEKTGYQVTSSRPDCPATDDNVLIAEYRGGRGI